MTENLPRSYENRTKKDSKGRDESRDPQYVCDTHGGSGVVVGGTTFNRPSQERVQDVSDHSVIYVPSQSPITATTFCDSEMEGSTSGSPSPEVDDDSQGSIYHPGSASAEPESEEITDSDFSGGRKRQRRPTTTDMQEARQGTTSNVLSEPLLGASSPEVLRQSEATSSSRQSSALRAPRRGLLSSPRVPANHAWKRQREEGSNGQSSSDPQVDAGNKRKRITRGVQQWFVPHSSCSCCVLSRKQHTLSKS